MASAPPKPTASATRAFLAGMRASTVSVFSYVLIGTYIGVGALAYDFGFSLLWVILSTLLVWVGPGQVILISALGSGAPYLEVALAVGLSSVRLFPMVVTLLALIKAPATRLRELLLPAHMTAVSMWIESLRLLPGQPRGRTASRSATGSPSVSCWPRISEASSDSILPARYPGC